MSASPGTPSSGTPHPAFAARDEDGRLVINQKTLIFVAFALLSGGGVSYGVTSARIPPEIAADISETKIAAESVKSQLSDLRVTLAKMQGGLDSRADDARRLEAVVQKHEERLNAVEKRLR